MAPRPSRSVRAFHILGPLLLVLVFRILTLVFIFPNGRHGFTGEQISAAIGLSEGQGLTATWSEVRYVKEHLSNLTLNMDDVYFPALRNPVTVVLPLPSVMLAVVWKVCGSRSILAYLLFMILAESLALAALFGIVRRWFSNRVVWIMAAFLALEIPLGRVVVSVTYDTYAYLGQLLAFCAGVLLLERRDAARMFVYSALSAITILGRELNLLLYPVIAGAAGLVAIRSRNGGLFRRAVLFLVPFFVIVGFTTVYRYVTTGNPRPTRSIFWHTLWIGVGQFPNPYGLTMDDGTAMEFARRIDPGLQQKDYSDNSPASRYETVLRIRAKTLFREHPWMLIRNGFYRTGMILSPGFYSGGDTVPARYIGIAAFLSLLGTAAMVWGSTQILRVAPPVFWMIVLTLAAQIISFSWFYIVGRVVLLASHVYILPLAVFLASMTTHRKRSQVPGPGASPA